MSDQGEQRLGWHLSKTVNVSHLLTTLALGASLVAWGNGIDRRVTVVETSQQFQAQRNVDLESRIERSRNSINQQLNKIDEKLDKLIERELNRNQR